MRISTKYLESRPILKPATEDIVFRCRFCRRPAANSVLYMMYYWSFSRFAPSWWTPLSRDYIPVSCACVGSTRWAHRLPQINHRLSLAELFHNYITRYSLTPPHNSAQCKRFLNIRSFSMYSVSHTSVTVPTAQSTDAGSGCVLLLFCYFCRWLENYEIVICRHQLVWSVDWNVAQKPKNRAI